MHTPGLEYPQNLHNMNIATYIAIHGSKPLVRRDRSLDFLQNFEQQ